MLRELRPALMVLLMLTAITGVAYPLAVTALGQLFFPAQAGGSLIGQGGNVMGSALLGQPFADAGHFWSRPSATAPQAYNGAASTGTNLSPTNPAFLDAVKQRVEALRAVDPGNSDPIPIDLVTASGSGLDPHISPAAARYQVARIARIRGLSAARVQRLVDEHTEGRTFGILGEPRVNVLQLNLALAS